MYHLSAPNTSRNPSLLLSLPRRRFELLPTLPGIGTPPRGECSGYWLTTPDVERVAELAVPLGVPLLDGVAAFEEIARGAEADCVAYDEEDEACVECLFGCWAESVVDWRKEEKNVERKKGR